MPPVVHMGVNGGPVLTASGRAIFDKVRAIRSPLAQNRDCSVWFATLADSALAPLSWLDVRAGTV